VGNPTPPARLLPSRPSPLEEHPAQPVLLRRDTSCRRPGIQRWGLAGINRGPSHSPCEVDPLRMAVQDVPPAEPGLLHRHKSCRRRGRGRWVPWGTPWPATPPQGSSLHARRRPRSTPAQPGPPAAPYVLPSSRQTAMGLAGINRSPCHSPCEVVLDGWRSLVPPRPSRDPAPLPVLPSPRPKGCRGRAASASCED